MSRSGAAAASSGASSTTCAFPPPLPPRPRLFPRGYFDTPEWAAAARTLAAVAAVLLALVPASVPAQDIFPPNEPRLIYSEDASSAGGGET